MYSVVKIETLISKLSYELAYLQCRADWWYYYQGDQDMSSFMLDKVNELDDIANQFGVLDEVYQGALRIYDFSKSGKEGYIPNIDFILQMDEYFDNYHSKRLLF